MKRPYYVLTNYNSQTNTYDDIVYKVQVIHYDTDKELHITYNNGEIGYVRRGYVWKLNTPHDMIINFSNGKYPQHKYNKYRLSADKFIRKCKRHNVKLGGNWYSETVNSV